MSLNHRILTRSPSSGSQPLATVVRNNVLKQDRGVYVIRSANLDVLYIGMTGTITQSGDFKGQGLDGRLTNTRGKGESAKQWFEWMAGKYGEKLRIEFAYCDLRRSPKFVESYLLQAYLNDFETLPSENQAF